jgi:LPXTG-motif cell wall-anchored protein
MTTARGRASRILTPLALVATAGMLLASPAAAAPTPDADLVDPVKVFGPGTGYDGVIDGRAAGTTLAAFEFGGDFETYCIEYAKDTPATGTGLRAVSWADSGVANLDKATYIAVNHATIGTPLAEPRAEKTATQLAIWVLTDGIDHTEVPNAEIVARTGELLASGSAYAEPEAVPGLTGARVTDVTALPATGDDPTVVQVTVVDATGAPVADLPITLSVELTTADGTVDDWMDGRTNAAGVAVLAGSEHAWPVGTEMTATANVRVSNGMVLRPTDGGQMLLAVPGSAAGTVTLGTFELPAVAADPTPTDNPTTPPAQDRPGQLPHTGAVGTPALFAGLVALAAVSGILFVRTRRRA